MIPYRVQFVPLTNSQPVECRNLAKPLWIHSFSGYREHFHGKSARDTGEFLKSVAHFLQILYKCYTFVIYNIL